MNEIRVRFAPSPTGALHIGGARTALFNWLFARKQNGKFILRIENTDQIRSTNYSEKGILEGLRWLGLDWDEGPDIGGDYGPYRQSERFFLYQKYLNQLLDEGKVYYCFCTAEEIEAQRQEASQKKIPYRYNRHCCNLSKKEIQSNIASGIPYVIRLKVPENGETIVNDLVRGNVSFQNALLDDFILMKSDGTPTYQLAVVIDDSLMNISHVIRAEEHLANTPKQILLYQALGFNPPVFAHISMILAPDRTKLSKRHGATSVQEFAQSGYLPQALLNYLVLLGWSPGTNLDILDRKEMIQQFDLNQMSKSSAIYDMEKINWLNAHYIAQESPETLLHLLKEIPDQLPENISDEDVLPVVKLLQSRLKNLTDFAELSHYFFHDVTSYSEKGIKKFFCRSDAHQILELDLKIVTQTFPFDEENLEKNLRKTAEEAGIKAASLIHPARLALTGKVQSPGIFEVMCQLGQTKCQERLLQAESFLNSLEENTFV